MSVKERQFRVALAGIPNVGKSLIFNKLTGGKAWVGNWPGVTVEKKVGRLVLDGVDVEVVDLPGIYGLTAYSADEVIARDFIIEEKPDAIVCILSAINLERSLYLAVSLLELGANLVVDLNMVDLAQKEGYRVDHRRLESLLGVPVIPTVATTGQGIEELRDAIRRALHERVERARVVDYGKDVEEAIATLEGVIRSEAPVLVEKYPARWLSIKLLEGDAVILERVSKVQNGEKVISAASKLKSELEAKLGDLETYMVDRRYKKVLELSQAVVVRESSIGVSATDILDSILTHKALGIPFALSTLYLLFRFAFEVSTPFADLLDIAINRLLHDWVLGLQGLPEWAASLLADGIIAGVGAVMVFLPVIAFFFLGFAILEDSGYMARVAFLVDKIFNRFNLPGKSIVPLIIGFGCNVPAVMAARTIEDENDRKVTALIAPLSSCSARLPVYLVIGGAILGASAGFAVLSMYILGILFALLMGWFFRRFFFKGVSAGFIMELPPYLMPRLDNVAMKTWERTKRFLFKAGSIILLVMILVWLLSVTGPEGFLGSNALGDPELLSRSWVAVLGRWLSEAVFFPMGWDWRLSAALFFGFLAKEVVVGTLGVLMGVEGVEGLQRALAESHILTPLTAYAYMAFVLLYVPCAATLATIRNELGLKYAIFALAYMLLLAYIVALGIVVIGSLVGLT